MRASEEQRSENKVFAATELYDSVRRARSIALSIRSKRILYCRSADVRIDKTTKLVLPPFCEYYPSPQQKDDKKTKGSATTPKKTEARKKGD